MSQSLLISPSILACDFANIEKEIKIINSSHADFIHIDIMDGVYVPNISFGFPVCKAIYSHAQKPLDFHLMIDNPLQYIPHCKDCGAEIIAFHHDSKVNKKEIIQSIRNVGCKPSLAINPDEEIDDSITQLLPCVDFVLIMSVYPGFGGQKFIETTFDKIKKVKELSKEINPKLQIEVDGGVNLSNARPIFEAGADIIVAGNAIFNAKNPLEVVAKLKNI